MYKGTFIKSVISHQKPCRPEGMEGYIQKKEKKCQPRKLYPVKLPLRNEEIKNFPR